MSAAELLEHERARAVERRAEWRAGYESGLKDGFRRVWTSAMFAEIVDELVLLRYVAESLGKQADHWRAKFLDAVDVIARPRR